MVYSATFEVLDRSAAGRATQQALIISGESINYRELADRSISVAYGLRRVGIQPGDRVAVLMGDSIEWVVAFYAIGRVGGVVVPINPRSKLDELEYFLGQSGATTLIVDEFPHCSPKDITAVADRLGIERSSIIVFNANGYSSDATFWSFLAEGSVVDLPVVLPSDVALIQYTSGSTSKPKGAVLRHSSITGDALNIARRMKLNGGERIFSGLPFFHVGGTVLHLMLNHTIGGTAVSLRKFTGADAVAAVERYRCVMFSGVEPHFLLTIESEGFSAERVATVTKALSTGTPAILRRIAERMNIDGLVAMYGLSETSSNITMCAVDDPEEWRLETCGYPHPGSEVAVVDPQTLVPLENSVIGEVLVRGYNLMVGYHGSVAGEPSPFTPDGWLRTGDLGSIDSYGLLRFEGRSKDVLRVGGENVSATEVEEVIAVAPGVAQVAVIGKSHPTLGEVPVAFVTLVDEVDGAAFTRQLLTFIEARLASFKVPREIHILATMPSTGSGKIHKPTLKGMTE